MALLDVLILLVIAAILLVVGVIVALIIRSPQSRTFADRFASLRERWSRRPRPRTVTVIQGDEEFEVAVGTGEATRKPRLAGGDDTVRGALRARLERAAARRGVLLGVLTVLVLVLLVQLPRLLPSPGDRFVVLVAPFHDPDGKVSQTGRSVAQQLADLLPAASGNRVLVQTVADPPSNDDLGAALTLLERENADVLVWGEITAGGILDAESLRPMLAYRPTGVYAPTAWDGYTGRFALPPVYALAINPINGQAVLPDLLGALADYSNGEFDTALATLTRLVDDYPSLDPTLPYMLRGNMLWARGEYAEAANEYRRTGVMETPGGPYSPMALLANNLGAILQDARDPAARSMFERAGSLLGDQDLMELRYNWGIEELRAGHTTEAIQSLEQARNLIPPTHQPPTALLLDLAEAYRTAGRLKEAGQAVATAARQTDSEANLVPRDQRSLVAGRLRAAVAEEQGLVRLAQTLAARGPLLWEVQDDRSLPNQPAVVDALTAATSSLDQAVRETDTLAQNWGRRSTAEDAAGKPINGLIAVGQEQRAALRSRERQRWLAAAEIALGRAHGTRPQGLAGVWAVLTGSQTPLGRAHDRLETLRKSGSDDIDTQVLLGHTLRLTNQAAKANEQFIDAAKRAPQRPEPIYGQALIALPNDRALARQLLQAAISVEPRFFPARERLAQIAEEDQDWATAIEQRRYLAQDQPGAAATLALARTLRQSGPSGYAEAEQLLLPLANQNSVAALLELDKLYRSYGDSESARTALERARHVDPNNPEVAYELGNIYAGQGNLEGAEAQYRIAINARPNYLDAHLALGQLYMRTGRMDLATREYRAALDAGASDLAALKQIGAVLLHNGEYEPAVTAYERAREINEEDAEVRHGLAQAYLGRNLLDAAQAEEQKALELRSGNYPEAHVGLGDIALRRGGEHIQTAVEQYTAALQQNNRLSGAFLGLGRAAAAQGNWSVAQGYFQNAVNIDPDSAEAYLYLGDALVHTDNSDSAIEAYKHALERREGFAEAYFGLAQAYAARSQIEEASTNLSQALRLRPNYAEALLLQGKIYEQQGREQEAVDSYTRSISADNKHAEARYRRALVYLRLNQLGNARSDLEQTVKIQPNFPEAHYWLGRSYLVEQRPQQALDQFKEAVNQRGGTYPEARFYQGLAEEQLGQRENAIESFRAALQQDQNSPWSTEARAALTRLGVQ